MTLGKRERGVLPPSNVARLVARSRRDRGTRATARLLGIDATSVDALAAGRRVLRATLDVTTLRLSRLQPESCDDAALLERSA